MVNFILNISRFLIENAKLKEIGEKIDEIMNNILGPIMTVIGSAGIIYAIVLSVQYAKAEDQSKRDEAKKRLINVIIGVIVLAVGITLALAVQWDQFVLIFGYDASAV